jgi:hypothetical protein
VQRRQVFLATPSKSHNTDSPSTQMSSMADHNNQRQNGYARANMGYGNSNTMYANQYGRGQGGGAYGMHQNHSDMAALAHSFQGINLASQPFVAQNKNPMMSTAGGQYTGMQVAANMPYGATGQYVYPNGYGSTATTQSPGMYTPHASQYMQQLSYQGYQQQDNSPSSQNWTPTTAGATGDVPTLITPRRDSISSNENDQPATPSYAGYPGFVHGNVAINRSPSGVFSHSTPSPTSMVGPYGMAAPKQPELTDVSPRLKLLMSQEPAIPRAIPAPSSPLKPLDRALENQRGETNVYIRGLLPETTDENLEAWGSRFGDIKSSKSIIDLNTGLCKGYVGRRLLAAASTMLTSSQIWVCQVPQLRRRRELHPRFPLPWLRSQLCQSKCLTLNILDPATDHFFQESFYSKLKTFADELNTNLYVSNLPKSMNEHELGNFFAPHKVCSARILRDRNGHGRGVGFARYVLAPS